MRRRAFLALGHRLLALVQGLADYGYVDGKNILLLAANELSAVSTLPSCRPNCSLRGAAA
jgi:hypothetical protein